MEEYDGEYTHPQTDAECAAADAADDHVAN